MSFSNSKRVYPETARSLAFGAIGAAYAGIGTALENPSRMLLIQNLTDEILWFSFNGVDDHFPINSNVSMVLDVTANAAIAQGFFVAEGQRIYVKRLNVPTTGSVYVTSFYGAE